MSALIGTRKVATFMATKSFTSEFKFNRKSSSKLATALENSQRADYQINQTVNNVTRTESIQKIMASFLKGK